MNYEKLFIDLITGYLSGKYDRNQVSSLIADQVSIDDIHDSPLISNCEWALRHMNEEGYYTTEDELTYLLSCLRGERAFSATEQG